MQAYFDKWGHREPREIDALKMIAEVMKDAVKHKKLKQERECIEDLMRAFNMMKDLLEYKGIPRE